MRSRMLALLLGGLALSSVPGLAAERRGGSLCRADEQVFFNCAVAARTGRKIVSLCGSRKLSAQEGYLQYRFGRSGAPELVFPAGRSHPRAAFRYSHYVRFQVSRTAVSFSNRGVGYRIFDDYEGDITPPVHQQGVEVGTPAGAGRTVTLACSGAAESRLASLENILPCDRDDPLNLDVCR
jgi:hypothetical protein